LPLESTTTDPTPGTAAIWTVAFEAVVDDVVDDDVARVVLVVVELLELLLQAAARTPIESNDTAMAVRRVPGLAGRLVFDPAALMSPHSPTARGRGFPGGAADLVELRMGAPNGLPSRTGAAAGSLHPDPSHTTPWCLTP
jgi:hypothetical protein